MRICDRCGSAAIDQLTMQLDDQRFDLCTSCREIVLDVVNQRPTEGRDKRKIKQIK